MELHHRAMGCHVPYGISLTCHPTQVNTPRLNPARQTGSPVLGLPIPGDELTNNYFLVISLLDTKISSNVPETFKHVKTFYFHWKISLRWSRYY